MAVKVGARVIVKNAEMTEELGFGTYEGEVPLSEAVEVTLPSELSASKTPAIRLESTGQLIYGFQCWFTEAKEPTPGSK